MSNLAQIDKIVKQVATLEADDKVILFYKIQDLLVDLPEEKSVETKINYLLDTCILIDFLRGNKSIYDLAT
jgi:hypothetical protein